MPSLPDYIKQFSSLRQDQSRDYPDETRSASPHKPLLLLAVLDRFAEDELAGNQVSLDPVLGDLFSDYWRVVMPSDSHPNIALPFFHLTSDGFWHLIPAEGSENVVGSGRRLRSMRKLHDHTEGARLDDGLFTLLQENDAREALRRTLIETYFHEDVHTALHKQGHVHEEAYRYSRALLDHVRSEGETAFNEPDTPVRDKGFRRAIVEAYDHRCAISGIRVLTTDGLSAVDAAHIVPWSVSRNDDPTNGLALSKLCHWVFEKGLVTVTPEYRIRTSTALTAPYNTPGTLATLDGRRLLLPDAPALHPDADALAWHVREVFRGDITHA